MPIAKVTGTREADIEDLFDASFYLRLLNDSGVADAAYAGLKGRDGSLKRIERALGHSFDHYAPARYFLEKQVELLKDLDEATLGRFEELFRAVNAVV